MVKKSKIQTPDWILNGKSKPSEKKPKVKLFKIKKCPKCKSRDVSVLLGIEEGKGKGEWECKKCKWQGKNPIEEEVEEDEFLKYLEEKGDEE
jgi:transcription elongation factor Elf1